MNLFTVRIYEMFKKTLAAVAVAAVSVMSSLNSAAAEEEKILNTTEKEGNLFLVIARSKHFLQRSKNFSTVKE